MMGKKTDTESVHLLNHSKCMLGAFQDFRQDETLLDVTLVCNGKSLKAHKLVLASCSQFFKELFSENPCQHPIVILRHFDFEDLKACIDFIYKGELTVSRERLMTALKVAEDLSIRGLLTSWTHKEKYKQLCNQFCGKMPHRKKRKRHSHNSLNSQDSNYIKVTDSDQNVESDADNVAFSKSHVMDIESNCAEENLVNEKEVRPLVLHVEDTNNEESIPNFEEDPGDSNEANLAESNLSTNDMPVESTSVQIDTKEEIYDTVAQNIELNSQFDAYATYAENSNLKYVPEDEQNNSQDQSMESVSASEDLEKQSASVSSLSPKSLEAQQCEETRPPEEGKPSLIIREMETWIKTEEPLDLSISNNQSLFFCSVCRKTFLDRQHLIRHSKIHDFYKNNPCFEEYTNVYSYHRYYPRSYTP